MRLCFQWVGAISVFAALYPFEELLTHANVAGPAI